MTENDTQPAGDDQRDLDAQIAETDASIAHLTEQLADAGPIDAEERAATLTNLEELQGIRDALVKQRDDG